MKDTKMENRAAFSTSSVYDSSSSSSSSSSGSSSSYDSSSYSSSSDDERSTKIHRRHRRTHSKSRNGKSRSKKRRESVRKHSDDDCSPRKRDRMRKKRSKRSSPGGTDGKSHHQRHLKPSKKKVKEREILENSAIIVKTSAKPPQSDSDHRPKETVNNFLQMTMSVQEQQKAMIRRNAEIAKARLASGELQRAKEEQTKAHKLYGSVDWRAKKKLRTEKKKLEQTVAAGKKLAFLEERESARMDAFRLALGLPTAEAQRQAEWRVEATKALLELDSTTKQGFPAKQKKVRSGIIGPALPP